MTRDLPFSAKETFDPKLDSRVSAQLNTLRFFQNSRIATESRRHIHIFTSCEGISARQSYCDGAVLKSAPKAHSTRLRFPRREWQHCAEGNIESLTTLSKSKDGSVELHDVRGNRHAIARDLREAAAIALLALITMKPRPGCLYRSPT
jgi:hypothetical protein